ncbi:MAG: D-alanyl-D-alanine carboxypeptidase/D-alanyl-D-alanine endopeptidase [Acidimicrobiales bacterium]
MAGLTKALTVALGVLIAAVGGAVMVVRLGPSDGQVRAAARTTLQTSLDTTTGDSSTTVAPTTSSSAGHPSTTARTAAGGLSPAVVALQAQLDAALTGTNSCLDVESSGGKVLYQHQPATPMIPASTQKLLVAEAALSVLGPDYRFTTSVEAPAAPVNGLVSQLWLVGGSDPLLATPAFIAAEAARVRVAGYPWTPLQNLANALVQAGVKGVTGGIKGDNSYEKDVAFLPVWPASYQAQEQIGALSALSVDEGAVYTPAKVTLAADPPNYAASQLAALLAAQHVPAAAAADQAAPKGAVVLATVSSAPLTQIVESMIRASDDWTAELLVRAIDKEIGGAGTTAGGVAEVMRIAARNGVPLAGVHMADGSGLSRTDQATCQELLAALDLGANAAYAPVLAGLPVAGESGTLVNRDLRTALVGTLEGKTGSLDGVAGLVGIVNAPHNVHFAMLENDSLSDTTMFALEDQVVQDLGGFGGLPIAPATTTTTTKG